MCLTKLYIVVVIAGWLMTMRILSIVESSLILCSAAKPTLLPFDLPPLKSNKL